MISLSMNVKNRHREQKIKRQIGELDKEMRRYIDENDGINVPPKVGYLDEKTYPIYSTYNMSFLPENINPSFVVSDCAGREVAYTAASDGNPTTPLRIYRAYRYNTSSPFLFENTPVHPAYLPEGWDVESVLGLGCEYIVCCVRNTASGERKYHFVQTNGRDYARWNVYSDISALVEGKSVYQILYFTAANTLGLYCANANRSRDLYLYHVQTHALLKKMQLFNGNVDFSNSGKTITSFSNRYVDSLLYNEKDRQLVMHVSYIFYYTDNTTQARSYSNMRLVQIFDVDEAFLKTGNGVCNPVFSPDAYRWGNWQVITTGEVAGTHGVYDEYEGTLRYTLKYQSAFDETIIKSTAAEQVQSVLYGYSSNDKLISRTYYVSPDACPWGKRQNKGVTLLDGHLYFNCQSISYGSSTVHSLYEKKVDANGYLQLVPGAWWRQTPDIEDTAFASMNTMQSQKFSDGTVRWQRIRANEYVEDVLVDALGRRRFVPTNIYLPAFFNANYTKFSKPIYNNKFPGHYFLLALRKADNQEVILKVLLPSLNWMELDILPEQLKTNIKNNIATFKGINNFSYDAANCFFDENDDIYITIRINTVGGAYTNTVKMTVGETCPNWVSTVIGPYWGVKILSYDEEFGYYFATDDGGTSYSQIFFSKSLNGAAEKTFADVFAKQAYTCKLGLLSAVGLVAYTQPTPMLVGGKCTVIPAQDIALRPNAENHIFISRKQENAALINRATKNLLAGENAFNTILIATIQTNSHDPIETTYYDI